FSNLIQEAYFCVRKIRSIGQVESMDAAYEDIMETLRTGNLEDKGLLRRIDLMTRLHRVHSLNIQWMATKYNKEHFGDKQEIEVKTDDPTVKRFQAWESWHNKHIEDATTEDSNDVKQDGTT
ncbi:MAG TPA: hypothetical protein VMZ04_10795, partial [Anaerolineae bacterium]|nr:hypothetical protein [Anaerolineae bacterium]